MTASRILFSIIICLWLAGCTHVTPAVKEPQKPLADQVVKTIKAASDNLAALQKELAESFKKAPARKIEVQPLKPAYDPLEDQIVSFAMVNEDMQVVLYALSQAVGMNLIVDPSISTEQKLVTLNFEKSSAAVVLKEILNTFDLYYEVDQNVIRIKPFQERIFHLGLLDTEVKTKFDIGGDVFGVGETDTASGLSGNFKLSGQGAKKSNAYDVLEDMVKQVLSKGGKYSLNRLSGSLYVQDTPANIRSIAKLINHFKEMVNRQILIEARIIEVTLSDAFKYGIEWDILRGTAIRTKELKLNSAAWSKEQGLILGGIFRDWTINATVEALKTFGDAKVISNPSIRAKHGKPSVISVGTSFTYKKSVEITTSTTTTGEDETTEVEVSTVFDGLILGVIPFIEEDGKITMLINPIKSDVDQNSLELESTGGGQSISLPEVNIKEISTTIALYSGDVVILGGLISKLKSTQDQKVPWLADIPIIGYLFKEQQQTEEVRELVIILSVSLI